MSITRTTADLQARGLRWQYIVVSRDISRPGFLPHRVRHSGYTETREQARVMVRRLKTLEDAA